MKNITLKTNNDLKITLDLSSDYQLLDPELVNRKGEFTLWEGNTPIKRVVGSVADIPPYSDIPKEIQQLYYNFS